MDISLLPITNYLHDVRGVNTAEPQRGQAVPRRQCKEQRVIALPAACGTLEEDNRSSMSNALFESTKMHLLCQPLLETL